MKNEITQSRSYGNFALRRIPVTQQESVTESMTDNSIDKIKIIELSTVIDKWEQEVLFAENGYYSLKGLEAEKKFKEYIAEFNRFINSKITETSFVTESSKDQAKLIKQEKLQAIKSRMELYYREQLNEWELATYEEFLNTTIQRAIMYKNDVSLVQIALQNGLKVLEIIADKEDWNKKLYKYKKEQFVSDFYIKLINAFIKDKEVVAYQYFNKYKEKIEEKEREELEPLVNGLRINIIANNWAQEVFSYNLDDSEYKKELNNIKEDSVKEAANRCYSDLKKKHNRQKNQEKKEKNITNWKEVIEWANNDIDKADLYIDYSLDKNNINSKKLYINQIREYGVVKTDINVFLKLFDEIFSDSRMFKDKDISDFRGYLSTEDFQLIEKLHQSSVEDLLKTEFDYKYMKNLLNKLDNKTEEILYKFIKIYFLTLSEYKIEKKESVNPETRIKILDAILALCKERNKEENTEKETTEKNNAGNKNPGEENLLENKERKGK